MNLEKLHHICEVFVTDRMSADPAHDVSHVKRVVKNTSYLTDIEEANSMITTAAAWLHDCVSVAKDSELRSQASRLAAREAIGFLEQTDYPASLLDDVHHAIEAHSFSANIPTRTLEAEIVQDADRLEALGAIGIARCLLTGGSMGARLYAPNDPFCVHREPDDRNFSIDHFYKKLFTLPDTMKTRAGKAEAHLRADYMRGYLKQFENEIEGGF
ncbi:MAG: hypothetical protein ACI9H8_002375 [Lysobacterales bacterium]|jgi:uncharacterized protein